MLEEPIVRDLLSPENLPGSPQHVEFRSTHGSFVFLTERDVYKVKRAKDYGFFDYTSLAAREHFCREEVRLNRRTAPDVYIEVLPVFEDSRGHSLNRPGEVVDHAVHMRRLSDDRSARSLLQAGKLGERDLAILARYLAGFYREAEARPAEPGGLRKSIEENFTQLRSFADRFVDRRVLADLERLQTEWLHAQRPLLGSRPSRDGHGDLRLEHVYFVDRRPLVIDCIEFADRFRVGDPALDVAFLAMDLYRCDRAALAESFLGRFAYESEDYDFYPLADGYMSYRATVRGKVACIVAADSTTPSERSERKAREATEFLELARDFLARARERPIVIGVGGIIASGKTTVAEMLAPFLGAPIVSADATRKHLAGIPRTEVGGPAIYTEEFTARTQGELLRRGSRVLESGRPVVFDTSFRTRESRNRARELAESMNARFLMVECQVPEAVARQRLRDRREGVSDAREPLLDEFLAGFEPMTELAADEIVVLGEASRRETLLEELGRRGILTNPPA